MVWDSFHPGCWLVTHQDDFTKKFGLPGMANLNLEVFHCYWWGVGPTYSVHSLKPCFFLKNERLLVEIYTRQGTNISRFKGTFENKIPFPKMGYVSSQKGTTSGWDIDRIKS